MEITSNILNIRLLQKYARPLLQASLALFLVLLAQVSNARTAGAEDVRSIARLYSAAFDREPKSDGLNFWVSTWEDDTTLIRIAKRFYDSPEFTTKYGDLSNSEYVKQLYRNVLGREGATTGIDYWIDLLNGGVARARVLNNFSESPENVSKTSIVFSNMQFINGLWQFGDQLACSNSISGEVGDDELVILLNGANQILNVSLGQNISDDGYSRYFSFVCVPTGIKLRLYLIKSGKINAIYGDTDGDGIPNTNVFSIRDNVENLNLDLGVIDWHRHEESIYLTQQQLFGYPGVVPDTPLKKIHIGIERPPLTGLGLTALLENGVDALSTGWFGGANSYLERALTLTKPGQSPEADEARFFLAIASLYGLGTELPSDGQSRPFNRLSDILDVMGLPDDQSRGNIGWMTIPENREIDSEVFDEAIDYLDAEAERRIIRTIHLLEQVSRSFRTLWTRPDTKEVIEVDYADTLFLIAYWKLGQAFTAVFEAYELEYDAQKIVDLNTDENDLNDETLESFLTTNPKFLSLQARSSLTRARNLILDGVIYNLDRAITSIENETDDQENDLIKISESDQGDIDRTRAYLLKTRNSIVNGETLIHEDSDGDRTKDVVLNLKRFFIEGVDFRRDDLLPAFEGNQLDEGRPCLPDPTFNGVVVSPDLDESIYEGYSCD